MGALNFSELHDELGAESGDLVPHVKTRRRGKPSVKAVGKKSGQAAADFAQAVESPVAETSALTARQAARQANHEMKQAMKLAQRFRGAQQSNAHRTREEARVARKDKQALENKAARGNTEAAKHSRYAQKDPAFAARMMATKKNGNDLG